MKITFRPLEKSDFQLFADWLAQPWVQKWWREPATIEHVEKDYGDCTNGDYKTRVYVVLDHKKPIGIIQVFRQADYEDEYTYPINLSAIGIDYLIGELDYIGRGYGTQMIKRFIAEVIKPLYPGAFAVTADPELANIASIRMLEKAGFEKSDLVSGEHGPEQIMSQEI